MSDPIRPCILFTFNEAYAGPGLVAVSSALRHTDSDVPIVIGSDGLSDRTVERIVGLDESRQIEVVDVVDRIAGMPGLERFPTVVWARVFVQDLIPDGVTRVLYLDGDTMTRRPLGDLLHIDLHSQTLGACPSNRYATHADREETLWQRAGSPPAVAYFNTGVLVIDLERWVDLDVSNRIVSAAEGGQFAYGLPDQDVMNAVLWDDWYPLPWQLWNYPGYLSTVGADHARVVHFYGLTKPWEVPVQARHFQKEYEQAASAIGWDIGHSPVKHLRRIARSLVPVGVMERRHHKIEVKTSRRDVW